MMNLRDDFEFSDEIRPMPSHIREARIRGETQWRREIERLEQENALPIEDPGSQPDWQWYAGQGMPDSVDRARRYMYTHHCGVVLDDKDVEKLDSEDLKQLARRTVPMTVIKIAMSNDGKANIRSFVRPMTSSMRPPRFAAAIKPSGTPRPMPTPTAAKATAMDVLAPIISIERMSRPKWSVPKRCSDVGVFIRSAMLRVSMS